MSETELPYDLMVEDALRGVVRRTLRQIAVQGLPGEHHFYITFDTAAPGVELSDRLREAHPGEMTIVLQHQFWDLAVDDNGFQVGLSFQSVPETVRVPFEAVSSFVDPSVNFGLQFRRGEEPEAEESDDGEPDAEAIAAGSEAAAEPEAAVGADVVNLDAFRKK